MGGAGVDAVPHLDGLPHGLLLLGLGVGPHLVLELVTKLREDFTIMEKAPIMAFSWLKAYICPKISLTSDKTKD